MPLYRVEHSCPLTSAQQDRLAEAITKIHSEKFTTPSFFVNVVFADVSGQIAYIAGKRRTSSRLLGHVRTGPSRTMDDYNALTTALNEAWASIVGSTGEKELRATFILGDLLTGSEAGFAIPRAGSDAKWLRDHYGDFERKAQDGDEGFADLIKEIGERKDLRAATV